MFSFILSNVTIKPLHLIDAYKESLASKGLYDIEM